MICPVCDVRGSRDASDVSRRQAASVHVPARLTSVSFMQTIAAWAQDLARTFLAEALPRRWAHVQGVAARAHTLKPSLGADADLIEAAMAARHRLPPRTRRHRPARPGRRPLPPRRPARRTPAVPPGHAPLLRRHRGRRTRPGPRPDPRVRPAAAPAGRRADLLRHDHQPRRPAGPGAEPPSRDPRPLRHEPPGQPLDPPRHPAHAGSRRPRPSQNRPRLTPDLAPRSARPIRETAPDFVAARPCRDSRACLASSNPGGA